ncbi:GNAT family N-acetyltransferase [Streptomyces sp. NPDC090306]|uniref:GNAT family N-acetyltransferase n=1 Tax=Streptomyces sp. NPDC090306 TaxID=3365961 RepID=UPI00381871E5
MAWSWDDGSRRHRLAWTNEPRGAGGKAGCAGPPARTGAVGELRLFDVRGSVVGLLRYRVCADCRTGRILDVWIRDGWQGEGRGRELLQSVLGRHPGLRWSTTQQSAAGRGFFAAMSGESSVDFPSCGPLCPHLRGWLRRVLGLSRTSAAAAA